MHRVDFRVQHLNHSGAVISTHTPVDDTLTWGYRVTDKGEISYELSLTDDEDLVAAGADSFAPYRTDWRLQMSELGGAFQSIHAGIITNVGLKARQDTVQIAGRDWLEWLDQSVWFDAYTIDFNPANLQNLSQEFNKGFKDADFDVDGFLDGFAYYVWAGELGATQESVLTDIVNISKVGTDFVNLTLSFEGFGFLEQVPSYQILIHDEGTYLDHLKSLAASGEPYGFDFYVEWNKVLRFFGPRKQVGASPSPVWTLNTENVVIDTVPDFEWQNNGPLGTYILGLGPGQPAIWKIKHDQDSEDLFRRWLRLPRVGDLYQQSAGDVQYATTGLQYIFPHRDLKLSIYPDVVNPTDPGDGFLNHVGDVVRFRWPILPYHTINAFFWITQQDYHGDSAGNWVCDLGLQQIYDTSP